MNRKIHIVITVMISSDILRSNSLKEIAIVREKGPNVSQEESNAKRLQEEKEYLQTKLRAKVIQLEKRLDYLNKLNHMQRGLKKLIERNKKADAIEICEMNGSMLFQRTANLIKKERKRLSRLDGDASTKLFLPLLILKLSDGSSVDVQRVNSRSLTIQSTTPVDHLNSFDVLSLLYK